MPATLTIPHECLEHVDLLDRLLDVVWDIGGAHVTWGVTQGRHTPTTERVWVQVTGLPGRDGPLHRRGSTLNACAFAILHYEWPDPGDQPDPA